MIVFGRIQGAASVTYSSARLAGYVEPYSGVMVMQTGRIGSPPHVAATTASGLTRGNKSLAYSNKFCAQTCLYGSAPKVV
jgi:hypothetical protein